jgi:hypothetical protein
VLTCTRILEILNNFSRFVAVSIHGRFFGYSLLTSIFNYSLLANRFSHASATHAEAACLERSEATSTPSSAHHGHSAKASSSEEVIVIIKAHATETSHATERISILSACSIRLFLGLHSIESHAHGTESSSEEVVIIVEEAFEGVSSSEELSKNLIGALHVEVAEVCATTEPS